MREDPWKSPFTDFPCSVCLSVFLQASKLGNFNPIAEAEEDEKPIKHFTSLRTAVLDVHWSLYGRTSFRQLFAYLFIYLFLGPLYRCFAIWHISKFVDPISIGLPETNKHDVYGQFWELSCRLFTYLKKKKWVGDWKKMWEILIDSTVFLQRIKSRREIVSCWDTLHQTARSRPNLALKVPDFFKCSSCAVRLVSSRETCFLLLLFFIHFLYISYSCSACSGIYCI